MDNRCKKCLNRKSCVVGDCHYVNAAEERRVERLKTRSMPCSTCAHRPKYSASDYPYGTDQKTCTYTGPKECVYVNKKDGLDLYHHNRKVSAKRRQAGTRAHLARLMECQGHSCACCGEGLLRRPPRWIVKDRGKRGKVVALICRSCSGKLLTLNNVRRNVAEYGIAARGFDEVKVDACVLAYWRLHHAK